MPRSGTVSRPVAATGSACSNDRFDCSDWSDGLSDAACCVAATAAVPSHVSQYKPAQQVGIGHAVVLRNDGIEHRQRLFVLPALVQHLREMQPRHRMTKLHVDGAFEQRCALAQIARPLFHQVLN